MRHRALLAMWLAFLVTVAPSVARLADQPDLQQEVGRLKKLLWKSLAGRHFGEVVTPQGVIYEGVVVTGVSEDAVRISHTKGQETLQFAQCPAAWVESYALEKSGGSLPGSATDAGLSPADLQIDQAMVVIAGDHSTGTGFFVRSREKTWLYTAAHVLSGNNRLQVKLPDGRLVRKFGDFEAAEGGDMVRLEVKEPVPSALQAGDSRGVSVIGMPVIACGNSGGAGTVGREPGKILGVGPESIEIDAQVIQGNSGGPVIDAKTGVALAVVTHLTAARGDMWAEATRFSGVRRFGCRIDREWEWKKLTIEAFLQEGRQMKKYVLLNQMMTAALNPDLWGSNIFTQNREDLLAKEILALNSWVASQGSGGVRLSEADRKKRLRALLQGAMHRSRAQSSEIDATNYSWYHRESLRAAGEERKLLDKTYIETADSLR